MSSPSYISMIEAQGLKITLKPGGVLWLTPKAAITNNIRDMVRSNKPAILAELSKRSESQRPSESTRGGAAVTSDKEIGCSDCPRTIPLVLDPETQSAPDSNTGPWYIAECKCGASVYICERDYQHWAARRQAKNGE